MTERQSYSLGFLGGMAVVTALMIFLYAVTFLGETTTIIQNAILFLLAGVTMAFVTVGLRFQAFNLQTLGNSIMWTLVSIIIIWIIQVYAPFTLQVEVLNNQLFSVLMGVSEECFFRLFLCTFLKKITDSDFFSIVISAFTWAIYHIARYGASLNTLWVIGLAGCALGFVMLRSKMGDGPIFAHAFVNFMATGGLG